MRAIRVRQHGGPEVLTLEQTPVPDPGPEEILIRVAAAGVNPVDTYIRAGAYTMANLPYTPGFDAAGTVERVGAGAKGFAPGARVYTSATKTGAYAEFAVCDPRTVYPLPANISFAQGAALGIPYPTAFRALFQKARAIGGETVLIHGASGGVGVAAVQLARAAGLEVFGTSGTPEGRQLVKDQGAHHVLDHGSASCGDDLMRLTGGRGADIILEMLSNVNLGKDLTLLAKHGRVVIIGSRGPVQVNPRDAMSRDATILGMTLFNASDLEVRSIHKALYAGLENGTLRPVVGRDLPLEQAAEAHRAVIESHAHGKIILLP